MLLLPRFDCLYKSSRRKNLFTMALPFQYRHKSATKRFGKQLFSHYFKILCHEQIVYLFVHLEICHFNCLVKICWDFLFLISFSFASILILTWLYQEAGSKIINSLQPRLPYCVPVMLFVCTVQVAFYDQK